METLQDEINRQLAEMGFYQPDCWQLDEEETDRLTPEDLRVLEAALEVEWTA
jgi:hypothetical protein